MASATIIEFARLWGVEKRTANGLLHFLESRGLARRLPRVLRTHTRGKRAGTYYWSGEVFEVPDQVTLTLAPAPAPAPSLPQEEVHPSTPTRYPIQEYVIHG